MAKLKTTPNLTRPDDLYQALIDAQEPLSPADAERFRARLILLLANQVGDDEVVMEAITSASKGMESTDGA
ncbi:MAG: DUF2783 domain-containing protein [Alphaproteobacteria bacterium]|jgi:hypothetical protein